MPKKLNGTIKTIALVLGIFLSFGGIIWAFATQNSKLEDTITTQKLLIIKTDRDHDDIIVIKTDVEHIKKAVDRIEKKL